MALCAYVQIWTDRLSITSCISWMHWNKIWWVCKILSKPTQLVSLKWAKSTGFGQAQWNTVKFAKTQWFDKDSKSMTKTQSLTKYFECISIQTRLDEYTKFWASLFGLALKRGVWAFLSNLVKYGKIYQDSQV